MLQGWCKERKKKDYDTWQANKKRLTYISLSDGLSCNQSFSQRQTQKKVKEKYL